MRASVRFMAPTYGAPRLGESGENPTLRRLVPLRSKRRTQRRRRVFPLSPSRYPSYSRRMEEATSTYIAECLWPGVTDSSRPRIASAAVTKRRIGWFR
jgi:hypothetical protein